MKPKIKFVILPLLFVFATVGVLATLVTAVNAYDPPLSPEVQKVLQQNQQYTDRQKRAYFFLLGLYAGEKDNPEAKGAEIWPQHETAGFWTKLKRPWEVTFYGCGSNVCDTAYVAQNPKVLEELKKYQTQINNYIHLMEYEEGADLFLGDRNVPLVSVMGMPLPNMHRLFHVQLAQWLSHGDTKRVFDALTSSNRYLHSFYSNGTILERMIAIADMKMNAEFISAETRRNPKLRVPQALVDSISAPDPSAVLTGGAEQDVRIFSNIVHGQLTIADFELSSLGGTPEELHGLKNRVPIRPFLRPNETTNKYYELSLAVLSKDCQPSVEVEKCVPSLGWTSLGNPWHWVANPFGRTITKIFTVNFAGRRQTLIKRAKEIEQLKTDLQARV